MSETNKDSTGESMLGGVSIRSWNATFIIVVGMGALIYSGQWEPVEAAVYTVIGFLFGKAAGSK